MPYVTSIERMAEERGRVEDRLATQSKIALNLLRRILSRCHCPEINLWEVAVAMFRQIFGDRLLIIYVYTM
jgi:hypothetical protein